MNIFRTPDDLRRRLQPLRGNSSIAFVPTMGSLHAGHISLIEQARAVADMVIVSIYVNPLQFGPNEDLAAYPRTFEADRAACAAAGVDVIFYPANLYPANGSNVTLTVRELADCLCGASRPGHFDGVATVVNMLFNIVQPDVAIFGEKDWQQLTIIRRMVADLHMPLVIIGMPTMREPDGLAMSSRNRYLSDSDRSSALALSCALKTMQQAAMHGQKDVSCLLEEGTGILAAAGIEPEYLDVRDAVSLMPLAHLDDRPDGATARVFVAARVGAARLIDNMPLDSGEMPNLAYQELYKLNHKDGDEKQSAQRKAKSGT